eukprot:TRINITY_DN16592_c0_g1_i1.p1 TRINITY_DN16592_c0_g1~~TRINITY_DN16592_c0_g1_i1.p1  ORF type:complete len:199 (-),score=31.01 TRINITY_DN16592_c0_g1_i1:172-747(-)
MTQGSHQMPLSPMLLSAAYGAQFKIVYDVLAHVGLPTSVLSIETYVRLINVVHCNGQLIKPLPSWRVYLNRARDLPEHIRPDLPFDELDSLIEKSVKELSAVEGTGLYELHACLNHSCKPNCRISFLGPTYDLSVVAGSCAGGEGVVASGDELTFSYVPSDMTHEDKRTELMEFYGFECACSLCRQQTPSS